MIKAVLFHVALLAASVAAGNDDCNVPLSGSFRLQQKRVRVVQIPASPQFVEVEVPEQVLIVQQQRQVKVVQVKQRGQRQQKQKQRGGFLSGLGGGRGSSSLKIERTRSRG